MDRREFLQTLSASVGSAVYVQKSFADSGDSAASAWPESAETSNGYTFLTHFEHRGEIWKAYEDLRSRDGNLILVSAGGKRRSLSKTTEATSPGDVKPYLGLTMEEIVGTAPDLLGQRVLDKGGDPDEELVRSAIPPIGWPLPDLSQMTVYPAWVAGIFSFSTFVGTKDCWGTLPITPDGSTVNFISGQYYPDVLNEGLFAWPKGQFFDGLVGGWQPVIRKVFPVEDGSYWEVLGFADVEKHDRFIVHTWQRVTHVEKGRTAKVSYFHSYPHFKRVRAEPQAAEFYRGLLASIEYWEEQVGDVRPVVLPKTDWADMVKHAFVKELVVRPGGVYPKYGTLNWQYGGSDHDGFPDTFTNAVYANLEWGRFSTAKTFIENYFDEFIDENGAINYRGPEIGQYGLMLALLAKYYRYTSDASVLLKYRDKLRAITRLLSDLHDDSLKLPKSAAGHGLIHGWSEADSSLRADPEVFWKPYFSNSALAVRGFRDLGHVWLDIAKITARSELSDYANTLIARSGRLRENLISKIERAVRTDMKPPYVGAWPGAKKTFDEDIALGLDSPEAAAFPRPYMELLQADVLPLNLAATVVDCLRAHGGNTLGIPGARRDTKTTERSICGAVTYAYAQTLLRLERPEEFLLFLYSHRYHVHQRGHWTAREAAGISRRPDTYVDPYCTPAQQAVPLLIRWMLVLEDSDEERLYLGRGVPRAWVASGKEISIKEAPTSWGGVSLGVIAKPEEKILRARVELTKPGAPKEFQLTLRVPEKTRLQRVTVNGRSAELVGRHKEAVLVKSQTQQHFEVDAHYS